MTILKSGEEVDAKCHSVWGGGGERGRKKTCETTQSETAFGVCPAPIAKCTSQLLTH